MHANVNNSALAVAAARREMKANFKNKTNGLAYGREILSSQESVETHAAAYSQIVGEIDRETNKEKREKMTGREEIKVDMKLMSDAVSAEKVKLRKETNDDATAQAQLHAKFPLRIKKIKGCYVVLTHAEFDAKTGNMQGPKTNTDNADASGESDESGKSGKGADKSALLIAELQSTITALRATIVERDATITELRGAVAAATLLQTVAPAKVVAGRARTTSTKAKKAA